MSQSNEACQEHGYQLCFELKQHSPLIHFQAGKKKRAGRNFICEDVEEGVTLRGSDIKPKLDKFLQIYAFENNDYDKYTKKDSDALDYDITVILKNLGTTVAPKGSYFGDFCALKNQILEIQIVCYIPAVLKEIKKYFEEFICINSFMTRSGKEFGDYTLAKTTKEKFEKIIKKYFYLVPLYLLDNGNKYELLSKIDDREDIKIIGAYKVMKAGDKKYLDEASVLMKYFANMVPPIRWEKRWIKHKLSLLDDKTMFNDLVDEHNRKEIYASDENEQYAFIRPLLGYMENFEYLTYSYKKCQQIKKDIKRAKSSNDITKVNLLKKELAEQNQCDKIIIKIKPKNSNFQRYASPFEYKVFRGNYYFVLSKSYNKTPEICGETFEFYATYKNGRNSIFLGELSVPEDFSITDYIKYSIERINHD